MEAVRAFNNELSSLYETRPPVSRAKMASVTKHAIKAIKFYKHVVQSVEKFVQKCKPEYKVPGLYVIDSIVRQSRHQFGSEKDVFGPRFTKNIVSTFQNLFKCPVEERSRVIRVLNLWQKNAVFPMEVIQPLLDLAADPNNVDLVLAAQRAVEKVVSTHQRIVAKASNGGTEENLIAQQSDIVNTVTKLLQQTGEGSLLAAGQESQIQQLQLLQQQLMMQTEMMSSKPQQTAPVLDNNLLAQIKLLTDQLLSKTSDSPPTSGAQASGGQNSGATACVGASGDSNMGSANKRSEPGFNKKLLDFDYGDSDDDEDNKGVNSNVQGLPGGVHKLLSDPAIMQHINKVSSTLQKSEQQMSTQELLRKQHLEQQQEEFNKEIAQGSYKGFGQQDVIVVEDQDDERDRERDYDRDRRRSRRSRDRSRSPRRRRHSRSRSRERRRSRDRHRRSRSRDHDHKCISVCTRTLWFGHLAKHTTEDELRAEIEKYGPVETINMVPPRGCAFVCMARRKEAAKALDRMKGFKLNSSALRVAWAPGVGVKESNFRDLWDVELGVTYIPWNKLPGDISPLLEGAIIDEDSLPEHLKGSLFGQQDQGEDVDHRTVPPPDNHNPQMMNPMHNFSAPPGPGQPAPNPQVPSMSGGQIPMPGHLVSAQPSSGPPGMPPNMLPHQMGAVSTPMSLPGGVSLSQAVSAAASLLGAPPNMLNPVTSGASMDSLGAISSAQLLPPGQQPGLMARPGFPPPGAAFGLPPNMPPRPGFPMQGVRLPTFPGQEREMEEPKEWPADDKMLEEEALAEMEEDIDHRMGMGGDAGKGPTPLMSLPMMGMRMHLPGPGGPRMQMQVAGGAPRPGMMLEVNRPETSLAMGPGGAFSPGMARPGLLGGPRMMRPGMPQEGAEGVMRSPLPGGIMGAQGGPAMGLRLGMGAQGPGSLPLGQRMPGMSGSPGLRGIGGQGPIRILLGNQSPRGPGGLGVRPGGLPLGEAPTSLGQLTNAQGPRGAMEDGQGPLAGMGGPNQGQSSGPVSQSPGLLQNLMMGAALRGGRPGLLGVRPNMPVNGGFRFGPPGGMNFGGPRPEFLRLPGGDKPVFDGPPGVFGGGLPGDEGNKSPEYGEGFMGDGDTDLRGGSGRPGADLSSDMAGMTKPRERAGRQSRWSDVERSDAVGADGPNTESNGPTSEVLGLAATEVNQTGTC
ncbi:hypothetical protein BaRGS_00005720 [Batillaria attramentaria]|uniref:Uncharacterized protein n=1 Tax=Batillaria attramentaria TaxID=370345 RepID=A0ABD0LVN8_9CAEN